MLSNVWCMQIGPIIFQHQYRIAYTDHIIHQWPCDDLAVLVKVTDSTWSFKVKIITIDLCDNSNESFLEVRPVKGLVVHSAFDRITYANLSVFHGLRDLGC